MLLQKAINKIKRRKLRLNGAFYKITTQPRDWVELDTVICKRNKGSPTTSGLTAMNFSFPPTPGRTPGHTPRSSNNQNDFAKLTQRTGISFTPRLTPRHTPRNSQIDDLMSTTSTIMESPSINTLINRKLYKKPEFQLISADKLMASTADKKRIVARYQKAYSFFIALGWIVLFTFLLSLIAYLEKCLTLY